MNRKKNDVKPNNNVYEKGFLKQFKVFNYDNDSEKVQKPGTKNWKKENLNNYSEKSKYLNVKSHFVPSTVTSRKTVNFEFDHSKYVKECQEGLKISMDEPVNSNTLGKSNRLSLYHLSNNKFPQPDSSKAIVISRRNSEKITGDEDTTTNICINGLPNNTNSDLIRRTIGSYGPIVSIHIVRPSPNSKSKDKSTKLRAYVQFSSRKDAVRCIIGMENGVIGDCNVSVSFAKSRPNDSIIFYPPPLGVHKYIFDRRIPFSANPLPQAKRKFKEGYGYLKSPFCKGFYTEEYRRRIEKLILSSVVPVYEPKNKLHKRVIDEFVVDCIENRDDIRRFISEMATLASTYQYEREEDKDFFASLFTHGTIESNYFIWRAFSLMNGDTFNDWATDYYRIFKNGPVWIPPNSRVKNYNEMPEFLYSTAYNYKEEKYYDKFLKEEVEDKKSVVKRDLDNNLLSDGCYENPMIPSLDNLNISNDDFLIEEDEIIRSILSFLD